MKKVRKDSKKAIQPVPKKTPTREDVFKENVRVVLYQEEAASTYPATARIFYRNVLVATVTAKVELKSGANGGRFPCVTLAERKS